MDRLCRMGDSEFKKPTLPPLSCMAPPPPLLASSSVLWELGAKAATDTLMRAGVNKPHPAAVPNEVQQWWRARRKGEMGLPPPPLSLPAELSETNHSRSFCQCHRLLPATGSEHPTMLRPNFGALGIRPHLCSVQGPAGVLGPWPCSQLPFFSYFLPWKVLPVTLGPPLTPPSTGGYTPPS